MEDCRVFATVDLDAIAHNITRMKKKAPILAVIKTNAYGHGAVEIARFLEGNDDIAGYAVATAEEALQLRHAGMNKMILILGYVFPKDFDALIAAEIRFCVFRLAMAEELSAAAARVNKTAYVHIKVDTGMHRIGFHPDDDAILEIQQMKELPNLTLEGIFTHFYRADEFDPTTTETQYHIFSDFIETLAHQEITFQYKHCENSAAILLYEKYQMDLVRAGITLYGLCPSEEVGPSFDLQPALSLYSRIIHIKDVARGDEISYGGTYVADKKRRIATISIGYGDGYPRSLSNKGSVLIHGKYAPIVGRICMDQMMVDVTEIAEASIGDLVTLIGTDHGSAITMEELGDRSGRFNYELACDLGIRIPRIYLKNGKEVARMDFFCDGTKS